MTEEAKIKMREGRERAKAERLLHPPVKKVKEVVDKGTPVLEYSGNEANGFAFWPLMRKVMRPRHEYALLKAIEREIVSNPLYWNNHDYVVGILKKYFVMVLVPSKKKRKPYTGVRPPMTQEQKDKLREGRLRAKEKKENDLL